VVETGPDADRLFALAAAGDAVAWGSLLMQHGDRLCRMVTFRLDPDGSVATLDLGDGKLLARVEAHKPERTAAGR
jgi:hypothetical protein